MSWAASDRHNIHFKCATARRPVLRLRSPAAPSRRVRRLLGCCSSPESDSGVSIGLAAIPCNRFTNRGTAALMLDVRLRKRMKRGVLAGTLLGLTLWMAGAGFAQRRRFREPEDD